MCRGSFQPSGSALEAMGLGTFGIIGPQINVDEGPAVFVTDLTTDSIDVIIVAFDRDGFWPVNGGTNDLSLFQAVGNKDVALQSGSRCMRCDCIGAISGRRAGHCVESEFYSFGNWHCNDAIFSRLMDFFMPS